MRQVCSFICSVISVNPSLLTTVLYYLVKIILLYNNTKYSFHIMTLQQSLTVQWGTLQGTILRRMNATTYSFYQ